MTAGHDPERLLAEALRAHAVRTPDRTASTGPPLQPPPFALLSGAEPLLAGQAADTRSLPPPPVPARRGVSAWWIVLLAVSLGLAAGAIVGLISML